MQTIGETIKRLRKEQHIKYIELADKTGIGRSTLWRIEANISSVKSDYVYALCEELNCDPNTLFCFKNGTITKK